MYELVYEHIIAAGVSEHLPELEHYFINTKGEVCDDTNAAVFKCHIILSMLTISFWETKLEHIRPKKTIATLSINHNYHLEIRELILPQAKQGTDSQLLDLLQGLENQYVVL